MSNLKMLIKLKHICIDFNQMSTNLDKLVPLALHTDSQTKYCRKEKQIRFNSDLMYSQP